MIGLKSKEEVTHIHKAGEIVSKTLHILSINLHPGMSTYELEKIATDFIISKGGRPAFKNYKGFPGNICTSINNVVVHGIPSKKIFLKQGDIISVDVGVKLNSYFADSAYTFGIGKIDRTTSELLRVTKEALYRGIDKMRERNRLTDISHCIQSFVEHNGFNVVRDFVGHGIGYELHEDPEVPNFGEPNKGVRLEEGMVLAIEPMVNKGGYQTKVLDDSWTVITDDGSLSCHFEHTACITKDKPEILTEWQKEMR